MSYRCVLVILALAFAGIVSGRAQSVEVVARVPDGGSNFGPLLFAKDGRIFGTTSVGGMHREGTLFVIENDKGGDAKTLVHFDHNTGGAFPFGPIVEGPDGSILGATVQGGINGGGTIYKVTADGSLQTVISFDPAGPRHPYGGLTPSRDRPGIYYGSTYESSILLKGTLFEFNAAEGKIRTLSNEVFGPFGPLLVTAGDRVFGTARNGGHITVGPKATLSVGAIFRAQGGSNPTIIVNIKFGGHGGVDDLCGLGLDMRNALQQRLVAKGEDAFFFVNHAGGKFSDGSLFAFNGNGNMKTLRDFQKSDSLGGPVTEIVVADDGTIYGAMGPTQVFTTVGNRMTKTALSGAICQFPENGDPKIVWALNSGGPSEALAWHDRAIYGFQNPTLYRLVLPPSTPSR